jgi:hypothetical protein
VCYTFWGPNHLSEKLWVIQTPKQPQSVKCCLHEQNMEWFCAFRNTDMMAIRLVCQLQDTLQNVMDHTVLLPWLPTFEILFSLTVKLKNEFQEKWDSNPDLLPHKSPSMMLHWSEFSPGSVLPSLQLNTEWKEILTHFRGKFDYSRIKTRWHLAVSCTVTWTVTWN